jgi:hypothetical protein
MTKRKKTENKMAKRKRQAQNGKTKTTGTKWQNENDRQ